MNWAFWRASDAKSESSRSATRKAAIDDSDPGRADPATSLKIRARRRLIGAAALLLAAVIVVPMVLDPAPRPVADTVPIQIPSEKTPFTPRLPLPPVPDPAQGQGGPVEAPAAGAAQAGKDADPAGDGQPDTKAGDSVAAKSADKTADKTIEKNAEKDADKAAAKATAKDSTKAAKDAEAQRAKDLLEGRGPTTTRAVSGKFLVQAAALRNEGAAREMAARLKKAGLPSFTERVQVSDGPRWRVRVGPYGSREEAELARARLRELGTSADLITP
jgi:DedD protein